MTKKHLLRSYERLERTGDYMIDLILDLIFIGCIIVALTPVLLGLYGVYLVLKIFICSAMSGVWYVCSYPAYWIIHRTNKRK